MPGVTGYNHSVGAVEKLWKITIKVCEYGVYKTQMNLMLPDGSSPRYRIPDVLASFV